MTKGIEATRVMEPAPGRALASKIASEELAAELMARAEADGVSLVGFRVGVEFDLSGHRDLNGMIVQHSVLARRPAEQLGLTEAVQEAVRSAYEQWDGKG